MKKRAFRRREINVKWILVERNGTSNLLRFVDTYTGETWNAGVGSILYRPLPNTLLGYIYIQAKCDKSNYSKVEIVANSSLQTDDASFTYFDIWSGTRAASELPFMDTSDVDDFAIDSDVIDEIQNDIATLQSDMSAAQGNIGILQTTTTALQSSVSGISGAIGSLQSDMTNAQSDIGTLQYGVSDLQALVTLTYPLDLMRGDIDTLEGQMSTAQSDIDTLESEMDTAQSDISNKIDKVLDKAGQLAVFDSAGEIRGSGVTPNHCVPTGRIIINPVADVPDGFLECNGQAVSRATYSNLFKVLGVTFGNGNGSTTFNVPDTRGFFLRGWNHGASVDPDAASRTNRGDGTTGDNVGTKQADELKTHTHKVVTAAHSASDGSHVEGTPSTAGIGFQNTNATGGNETRPKNIYMMFIIKT
ncbi:MAG: Phage Tail Collar Domain protein [Candidatus Methanofastidiosum methylothiophilum]|uniref:Phage Tail Collar Domain protein n=1 Tax=Candidatus Methanofastidiosum methylothiophilum TaxID=1705564 RepID=A0A150J402_9EURY|nr:MAG: Phage Tail Collar Domain protein [Candidatus Methanofastidiosum methylthiophilus]